MFALPLSKPHFKSIIFLIDIARQKNAKFSSAGGPAPRPPCLRRLGALPPNPQNTPPHCEFLATRLRQTTWSNHEEKTG